jgi:hypothetical protein
VNPSNLTTIQPGKKNNIRKEKEYDSILNSVKGLSMEFNTIRINAEKTNIKSIALYVNKIGTHILLFLPDNIKRMIPVKEIMKT